VKISIKKMKKLIAIIAISIVSTLSSSLAQGQTAQAALVNTTIEPVTSQPNDTVLVAPKGNLTCNYYSFDLSFKLFNKTDDVEEFLAKNTKAACAWRRTNGNLESEFRLFGDFRRAEIKNSTIARFPAKFFTNFSKLVIFRARNVQLQEIKASDFEASDFLQLIDLSSNQIKKLASQQFVTLRSIKEIDLSGNQIDTIEDGAFEQMGGNLTRIDLSSNKLKSFREDFFLNMIVNVTRKWLPFDINLKNNEIEIIEPSKSDGIMLPEVNLELSGNKMKNLELMKIEVFEIKLNNHSLESINVNASFIYADNNRLTKLRIKGKTRSLSVRNNQISEITYDDHVSLLRTFLISDNKLTADIVADFSQKIVNVEVLDVSNNSLKSLKVDTFAELTRLERLSISNVDLSEISFGIFAYQKNLRVLDISYNNLSEIDLHILSSASNLEVLDLSGNNASMTISCRKVKDVLQQLKTIGLEDNNWICDRLSRMKICFASKGITVMDPVHPVKNESNIVGIKCQSNAELMKNTTTTTTVSTTVQATTNIHEKLNEVMSKVNQMSGGGGHSSGISSLELGLSIFVAISATLLIIYGAIKVKNYFKRNRFHMPFSGRNSPDTVITYEGSLGR
jgi:Leucine-rich repeat (LRR) protein